MKRYDKDRHKCITCRGRAQQLEYDPHRTEPKRPLMPPIDLDKEWKQPSADHTGFDYPKPDATEEERKAFLESLIGKRLYTVRPEGYKIRYVEVFSAAYDPDGGFNLGLQNVDDPGDVFAAIGTDGLFSDWSELVVSLYGTLFEMLRLNIRSYIVWKGDIGYKKILKESIAGLSDALDFAEKQFKKGDPDGSRS